MSVAKDSKLPLKVAINKHDTKVLFAEVDSDLADVLISFLTLPMGRILTLLQRHYQDGAPVIGSLNNLSSSLEKLDDAYFSAKECKRLLLNPRNLFSNERRKLKLTIDDETQPIEYFVCEMFVRCGYLHLSMYNWGKCGCNRVQNKVLYLQESQSDSVKVAPSPPHRVFSMKTMDFAVSDRLQIVPNGTALLVQNFHNFGITETDGMRQSTVPIGFHEAMCFLKGLFVSQTLLTDLVFKGRLIGYSASNFKTGSSVHNIDLGASGTFITEKLVVKAILQKSTNKLLFVQAKHDFVDFLFSFLTIPLGGMAHLLGGNTSIVSVDALYGSIGTSDKGSLVMVGDKQNFIRKLRYSYLSKTNILPQLVDSSHLETLYFDQSKKVLTTKFEHSALTCYLNRRVNGCCLKEPGMFLVTDDLTVTPSTMFSAVSHLNMLKIPASDVKEVGVEIGMEEGLSILKASLTSTTVLTDALIIPLMKKQPK